MLCCDSLSGEYRQIHSLLDFLQFVVRHDEKLSLPLASEGVFTMLCCPVQREGWWSGVEGEGPRGWCL